MESLSNLLSVLVDAKIDFVLVGGFAAVVHGSTSVTQDIDVCAIIDAEQIRRLRDCLRAHHPVLRRPGEKLSFLEYPIDITNVKNIYLTTDLGPLDVIGEVAGVGDYRRVASKADEIEIFGKKCKVICLEDLLAAKKAMGRQKDFATMRELEIARQTKK